MTLVLTYLIALLICLVAAIMVVLNLNGFICNFLVQIGIQRWRQWYRAGHGRWGRLVQWGRGHRWLERRHCNRLRSEFMTVGDVPAQQRGLETHSGLIFVVLGHLAPRIHSSAFDFVKRSMKPLSTLTAKVFKTPIIKKSKSSKVGCQI